LVRRALDWELGPEDALRLRSDWSPAHRRDLRRRPPPRPVAGAEQWRGGCRGGRAARVRGDRADLLAKVAGILEGASEGELDEPLAARPPVCAAQPGPPESSRRRRM